MCPGSPRITTVDGIDEGRLPALWRWVVLGSRFWLIGLCDPSQVAESGVVTCGYGVHRSACALPPAGPCAQIRAGGRGGRAVFSCVLSAPPWAWVAVLSATLPLPFRGAGSSTCSQHFFAERVSSTPSRSLNFDVYQHPVSCARKYNRPSPGGILFSNAP